MSDILDAIRRFSIELQKLDIEPGVTIEMATFDDWSKLEMALTREFNGMLISDSSLEKPMLSVKVHGVAFIPPGGEKQKIDRAEFVRRMTNT